MRRQRYSVEFAQEIQGSAVMSEPLREGPTHGDPGLRPDRSSRLERREGIGTNST